MEYLKGWWTGKMSGTKDRYGLSIRLSDRTKNLSDSDLNYIVKEKQKIINYCKDNNIILKSPDKIKEISVVNQIWTGLKYSDKENIKVYKIYIDLYISGGSYERKELLQMLNDFDDGLIKGFIFKNLNRYVRDVIFQEEIIKTYRDIKGADFRLIEGQQLMKDEISRKFMGVANEVPIIIGKRNAEKLMQNKIEAKLPCIPAPYGFEYNNKKNWDIVKNEAKIIKKVNKRRGKKEHWKKTCKDLKISKYLYYKILENIRKKLYNGIISFEKKIKDLKGNVVDTQTISYEANIPHIL